MADWRELDFHPLNKSRVIEKKCAELEVAPVIGEQDLGPGISNSAGAYYGAWRDSGSGGDGSAYRYGMSSTGSTPIIDHTLMRLNARSAYHDSMQGRAIIERFADLVPGVGLRLEATPNATVLGMEPEAAEAWAQTTENGFDTHMRSKKFSLAEDMTGYQTQRFVTIQQQRDGEYFARLDYIKEPGLNPLKVSFLDPSQIQGCPETDTEGYYYPDEGIKRDSMGREIAYKVLVHDPDGHNYSQKVLRRVGIKSKKLLMIHGFMKEYPGQLRGYSRIGHILQALENLTDFEFSHIKKAINESIVALWIKPSLKNPASDGGITDGMASAAGTFRRADNPQTEGAVAVEPSVDFSELNEVNARPGSWFNAGLQGGEELSTLKGTTPSDNYSIFVDAFVKSLGASVSLPSEVIWMQFGQNYSASRAALVLAWQVIEIWRAELAADFLNPIYEAWLDGEIAAGRITAPGWSDPILRSAWLSNNWIGFPMPNIDPSKTAAAHEKYVNMGATTLDRVARELNGSSGKANRAKLTRELEELPVSPFLPTAPAEPSDDDKDDDDKGKKSTKKDDE